MSGKINAAAIRDGKAEGSDELMAIVDNPTMSKSAKIRALFAVTNDRSTVANLLGIKYQHVRNVLLTQLTTKTEA